MLRFFKRFWSDQSGAMGYLGIVALIPLTVVLFYTVNSAKAVHDRTRNQDAADMIALMHASEAARSLNTLSMNQVSMTQVFATGVTSGSLVPIITAQVAMAAYTAVRVGMYQHRMCDNRYKILKAIPYVGNALYAAAYAACFVPGGVVIAQLGTNGLETGLILPRFDVLDAVDTSRDGINALNAANDAIYQRFPQSVAVQATQIAEQMNARDLYFDDSCADPGGAGPVRAASCDDANDHQGMNLPVVKNLRSDGYLRFCLALHNGTGGMSLPGPLGALTGGGATGISLINGSYLKRGFRANKGPLGGGGSDETPHLRDHVNDETRMGLLMEEYWGILTRDNLFDGLINPAATIAVAGEGLLDVAGLAAEELKDAQEKLQDATDSIPKIDATSPEDEGGLNWPKEQTEDDNMYKDLVNLRVLNQCAGDPAGALLGGMNLGFIGTLTGALPNVDVYHPAYDGMGFAPTLPDIQPTLEDYSDHFKILAFTQRIRNDRWAPEVFQNPSSDFFAFSQAIVYNEDEIGLYSQNWKAILMPASKFEDTPTQVTDRLSNRGHGDFSGLGDRMQPVVTEEGWDRVTVR